MKYNYSTVEIRSLKRPLLPSQLSSVGDAVDAETMGWMALLGTSACIATVTKKCWCFFFAQEGPSLACMAVLPALFRKQLAALLPAGVNKAATD